MRITKSPPGRDTCSSNKIGIKGWQALVKIGKMFIMIAFSATVLIHHFRTKGVALPILASNISNDGQQNFLLAFDAHLAIVARRMIIQ